MFVLCTHASASAHLPCLAAQTHAQTVALASSCCFCSAGDTRAHTCSHIHKHTHTRARTRARAHARARARTHTHAHTQTRTPARTAHTHTHTNTRSRNHTRSDTRTRTHLKQLFGFDLPQGASLTQSQKCMLPYTATTPSRGGWGCCACGRTRKRGRDRNHPWRMRRGT